MLIHPGDAAACTGFPACLSNEERMRKANRTGTNVKDSARLAINDTQTDSDRGENRYLAVPCRRNTGTKTMQMHIVESTVGPATSPEPSTMAFHNPSPSLTCRSMFSI